MTNNKAVNVATNKMTNNKAANVATNKMTNNKAANVATNKMKTAMSYVYNTPVFFIITFLLCFFIYQMIHAHRDRNDIIKHKVETEIKKKLYY